MNKMFYYTSTDTARKILTNGEIWATNIKYMNDSEEFSNGLNEIEKYAGTKIDRKKLIECVNVLRMFSNVKQYTISLCGREDALSQWSMYAKESGGCLGMDFEGYDATYKINGDDDCSESSLNFEHVIYCTDGANEISSKELRKARLKIIKLIDSLCDNDSSPNVMRESVTKCAALIKRYEFFQEDEFRAIFNLNYADPKCIDYRIDKGVLKSYVRVECNINREAGWPIVSIMIGPGFNQSVVFNSWMFFLDNTVLKTPKITEEEHIHKLEVFLNDMINYSPQSCYKALKTIVDNGLKKCKSFLILEDPEFSVLLHNYYLSFIEELKNAAIDDNGKDSLKEFCDNNYLIFFNHCVNHLSLSVSRPHACSWLFDKIYLVTISQTRNRCRPCETALYSGFSSSCVAVQTAILQSERRIITRISEKITQENHTGRVWK